MRKMYTVFHVKILNVILFCFALNIVFHFGSDQWRTKSKPQIIPYVNKNKIQTKKVILCFPLNHELDILHLKLLLLSEYVDLFVISESQFSDRGLLKPKHFEMHKRDERFLPFQHQIMHVISDYEPMETDYSLGWKMNSHMKECIGKRIVNELYNMFNHRDSIVIFGDADEIPSPSSIQ